MSILSGIFRCVKYIKTDTGFQKVSEWQSAKDVELADGSSVESKVYVLNTGIETLKKSVSDGKKAVASAITAQGVNTAADAPYTTMATNITTAGNTRYNAGVAAAKKGTATAAQVLTGYTFTNTSGTNLLGALPINGQLNWAPAGSTSTAIAAGYYSGGTLNSAPAYNAGYNIGYSAGQSATSIQIKTITNLNTNIPQYSVGYVSFDAGFAHAVAGITNVRIHNIKNGTTYNSNSFSMASCSVSGNTVTIGIAEHTGVNWNTGDNVRIDITVSGY